MEEKKKNSQLTYYYKNKEARSAYAKAYYAAKKLKQDEKKPRKRYKTWRSNLDKIHEFREYLKTNEIKEVTLCLT
jgi:uncharacterized lipoprotein YddW (UPF0748 family)